jgi:hypothetical protein
MTSKLLSAMAGIILGMLALAQPQPQPEISATPSQLPVLTTNTPCRFKPKTDACGLPLFLANYQVRFILDVNAK